MACKAFKILTLLIFIASSNCLYSQRTSHYTEKDRINKDTLTDKEGIKFIIDKERVYVTAIDKQGRLLWKTDPAKDNKLEHYRVDRPKIVYFELQYDGFTKSEVVWIIYQNTQFGTLNKRTGKFSFRGQD